MVSKRKALETLWKGLCTVIVQVGEENPDTNLTEFEEQELYAGQPCHLSFKSGVSTPAGSGEVALVTQTTTLFIGSELAIPAGSKIIVTQNGVTTEYARSGEPRLYADHQEIDLVLFERWA